jgi:hypothetical protein
MTLSKQERKVAAGFVASSLAPAISCLVTNPIEVIKVCDQISFACVLSHRVPFTSCVNGHDGMRDSLH